MREGMSAGKGLRATASMRIACRARSVVSSVAAVSLLIAFVTRVLLAGINWYTLRVFPPPWTDNGIVIGGWAIWDTGYYTSIAINGYDTGDPGAPAFFPLFPLLIRGGMELFGMELTHPSGSIIAVGIATICFLALVPLFAMLVRDRFGDGVALTATVLLCVSPFSFFLTAGYTESLFLLLVVVALMLGGKGHWVTAAIVAALASATRSTGLALLPALLYMAFRQNASWRDRLAVLAISPLGLVAFGLHLWQQFGNPLQFLKAQEQWSGREFRIWFFFDRIFVHPRTLLYGGPDRHDLYVPVILLNVVIWAISLVSLYWVFRWIGGGIAIFTAMIVVFHGLVSWISLGRYLLPAIGVYIVIALAIERSPWREPLRMLLLLPSAMLLVMLLIMFGHGHWVI